MVTLCPDGSHIKVCVDSVPIGSIRLYDNPCHDQNCYIKLELDRLDIFVSKELFAQLRQIVQRPLQAMVDSNDKTTVDFLTAGGFVCKRKCYELEAQREDWLGAPSQTSLLHTHAGEQAYEHCCQVMYAHYIDTHRTINPWTAEFSDFCRNLPTEAVYEVVGERIVNLALVDGGEIAYIYAAGKDGFVPFAASLIHWLFSQHDTITFESDNCDWAAMELKAMFANQDETSFDTYIF